MAREQLPTRRQNETVRLSYNGREVFVTVGRTPDGRPLEVFASVARTGTEMAHLIADACVIISLALQHGAEPAGLAKSLGVIPDPARGEDATKAASLIGEIVAVLVEAAGEVEDA